MAQWLQRSPQYHSCRPPSPAWGDFHHHKCVLTAGDLFISVRRISLEPVFRGWRARHMRGCHDLRRKIAPRLASHQVWKTRKRSDGTSQVALPCVCDHILTDSFSARLVSRGPPCGALVQSILPGISMLCCTDDNPYYTYRSAVVPYRVERATARVTWFLAHILSGEDPVSSNRTS